MSSERHWMLQGAEGRFLLPRGNCYFWQKVIYLLGHHCEDGRWLQFRLASSNVSLWVTIGPWLVADVIYDACAVKLPLRRVRADVKEADSAGNMAPKLSELPGILHLLHKRRRFCVSFFLKATLSRSDQQFMWFITQRCQTLFCCRFSSMKICNLSLFCFSSINCNTYMSNFPVTLSEISHLSISRLQHEDRHPHTLTFTTKGSRQAVANCDTSSELEVFHAVFHFFSRTNTQQETQISILSNYFEKKTPNVLEFGRIQRKLCTMERMEWFAVNTASSGHFCYCIHFCALVQ